MKKSLTSFQYPRSLKMNQRKLTLGQYVIRRTGLPMGSSGSLRSMFGRSFQASSPRDFWKYWNPLFGYYLGKYIYSPLKKIFPASLAIILTFLFSGFIHDLATIMVKGSTRYLFTIWFLFLGLGALLGGRAKVDLSNQSKLVRITMNLMYILLSFGFAYAFIFDLSVL